MDPATAIGKQAGEEGGGPTGQEVSPSLPPPPPLFQDRKFQTEGEGIGVVITLQRSTPHFDSRYKLWISEFLFKETGHISFYDPDKFRNRINSLNMTTARDSRFLGKVANGVVFSLILLLIKFGALQNRAKLDTQLRCRSLLLIVKLVVENKKEADVSSKFCLSKISWEKWKETTKLLCLRNAMLLRYEVSSCGRQIDAAARRWPVVLPGRAKTERNGWVLLLWQRRILLLLLLLR